MNSDVEYHDYDEDRWWIMTIMMKNDDDRCRFTMMKTLDEWLWWWRLRLDDFNDEH